MNNTNIKQIIKQKEYNFLRTNNLIKDNILFLTIGGSHAYGTNNENSDIDIRGCILDPLSNIIQSFNFETVTNTETDTTIYTVFKLIKLLTNANPNIIELLGNSYERYYIPNEHSKITNMLLDNKNIFLSKNVINAFSGYAGSQLRRLQCALARDKYTQAQKENHIIKSCNNVLDTLQFRTSKKYVRDDFELYIDKSDKEYLDEEIFCNINLKKYPLRDTKNILNELTNVIKSYDKNMINGRNKKKDDNHLNKHAMHLVRLYLMCFDILEKREINTYREHDRNFLLDIRNGKYQKQDGTYYQEFFELIDEYDKRIKYDSKHTELPDKPNNKVIDELKFEITKYIIEREQ